MGLNDRAGEAGITEIYMAYRIRHAETFWNKDEDADYPDEFQCYEWGDFETLEIPEFSAQAIYRAVKAAYSKRPIPIREIQEWIESVQHSGDENHCLPVLFYRDYPRSQSYIPHDRVEVWLQLQSFDKFEERIRAKGSAIIESVRAEFVE